MTWEIFEHKILSSLLAFVTKLQPLVLCYSVKLKRLPLSVLQAFTAIFYLCLLFFNGDIIKKSHDVIQCDGGSSQSLRLNNLDKVDIVFLLSII